MVLATLHGMTASVRLPCKVLLKADAGGDGNEKAGQKTSRVDEHDNAGTSESHGQQISLEVVVCFFCPQENPDDGSSRGTGDDDGGECNERGLNSNSTFLFLIPNCNP